MTTPWTANAAASSQDIDPRVIAHGLEPDGYTTTTAVLSDGRLVCWLTSPGMAGAIDPVDLARHLQASTPAPTAAHRQVG